MNLITLSALTTHDVRAIWHLVKAPKVDTQATVAWSFEGNGIRTRTTFLEAFSDLRMTAIELPNFLKSSERVCDLAGYLDPFYDLYVIRESNHERLADFAASSRRPVINAMSKAGHPCEVLTDASTLFCCQPLLSPLARSSTSTPETIRTMQAMSKKGFFYLYRQRRYATAWVRLLVSYAQSGLPSQWNYAGTFDSPAL